MIIETKFMQGNRAVLIGYVGKELEIKKLENGDKRAGILMATHYKHKDQKGDFINHTVWHNIVAWNDVADYAERSFVKGSRILVEGTIDYSVFPDVNGHMRYYTKIKAQSLMNLDR
jgi:single-strand DNA-binding protein